MKFSENWLRELVDLAGISNDALCERLTMSGLEVESVTPASGSFSGVVVAEIIAVAPHPNADKLRICQVTAGAAAPLTIVTGAANVRAGMRLPLATIGAVVAGDKHIKQSSLRGVDSFGMLCSAAELGLHEQTDGIMELPADAPLGEDLRQYLQLDDQIIELNITPNRGDCLSLSGLARDVATQHNVTCHLQEIDPLAGQLSETLPIQISAPAACPCYVGRLIKNVNVTAKTPLWLTEKLRRGGIRSISAVVDITNYVMLELGQPLHAFDRACIDGGIEVRMAHANETLTLLDGQTLQLTPDTLLIADNKKPLALAGIMGGQDSGIQPGKPQADIFLESAYFEPLAVAGRGRAYKLHTDSLHRFERGVDRQGQTRAIERATRLIVQICGGQPAATQAAQSREYLPALDEVILRRRQISRLLGFAALVERTPQILRNLGMTVQPLAEASGWKVNPPSWRHDIRIEADLIEEVMRIGGYQQLPLQMPGGRLPMQAVAEAGAQPLNKLKLALVQRGYHEVITYSFVDAALNQKLSPDPLAGALTLSNPIAANMAVMRHSLLPGLLSALQFNLARQQNRVRIFESGKVFVAHGAAETENSEVSLSAEVKIAQINKMAGLICGSSQPEQWGIPARAADFFDAKADALALLTSLDPLAGDAGVLELRAGTHPALHPGQAAELMREQRSIGIVGALHPDLIKFFDFPADVFVYEMSLDALLTAPLAHYQPLSKFPLVRRDLSLLVDVAIAMEQVSNCIKNTASKALVDLQCFDVYQGEGIDSGKKSVALGLLFQDFSRTLTDADIEAEVAKVVARLKAELNAILRA